MALGIVSFKGVYYHTDINLDSPVYKFYSLQRFLEAVNNKQMYFRNIIYWDDNWELPTRLFETSGLDEYSAFLFNKYNIFPTFASCFTSHFDTASMWQIYSPNKSGVCIETTARALLKEISLFSEPMLSVCYAPVIYVNVNISSPEAIFNQERAEEYPAHFYFPFIKRDAFSYEHEIRLAIHPGSIHRDQQGLTMPVDMRKVINKVILDPRLTKDEVSYHKTSLNKLGFHAVRSSLFTDVKYNGKDYEEIIKKVDHGTTITGTKFNFFE